MSDDATQDLLQPQLDQLVTMIKNLISKYTETNARLERIERRLVQELFDTRPA